MQVSFWWQALFAMLNYRTKLAKEPCRNKARMHFEILKTALIPWYSIAIITSYEHFTSIQCKQPYDPLVLTVSSRFLGHVLFFVLYNVNQYNVVSCSLLLEDFWKKRWGCQLEHFGGENWNKPATRWTHAAIRVMLLSRARDPRDVIQSPIKRNSQFTCTEDIKRSKKHQRRIILF